MVFCFVFFFKQETAYEMRISDWSSDVCSSVLPGGDLHVLDAEGKVVAPGTIGALVGKLPMPPGSSPTLWNAKQRYFDAYLRKFPGYYETGDAGIIDEDGYVPDMARTDDKSGRASGRGRVCQKCRFRGSRYQ